MRKNLFSWQNSICQIYGWRPILSTVFLLLFTAIFAQNVATQSFSVIGYDDENLEISISPADITVNNGEEIQSISISNFTAEFYFFGEGDDYFEGCEDGWYDFDFSVTGGVSDGEEMTMVCGSEFIGLDVTGFSNLTVTTYDADAWSDELEIVLTLEVTYGEGGNPEPGDGCEWTVTVEDDGFGDEVSWELRGADGTVLLSGGDYGLGYTDIQTVTAEGPVEFYIEAMGTYNDNDPSYSVSNGTEELVSGELVGGDDQTYSDLMCGEGGGDPEPGDGCEWTVTVEDDGFGDEVSWELRGADGTVLLSGGDYGLGYTDIQTVTAEGPVEFYIEAMGTYNDNDPSYSVSNGTEELVSGELVGGDAQTYSDLMCGEGGEDPDPQDYCDPVLDCTDGDLISNVTFQEIDNTTDCSPNGYGDYTDKIANVEAGQTYPISITVGDGWYEHAFVWIDFGNDGSFDEAGDFFGEIGEGGTGVTVEGEIAIPADVAEGEYRMRVLAYAGPEPDGPCMNNSLDYGEYEDYTVSVTAGGNPEPGEGNTCEDAITVTSLPYDHAGNTADYGNDYDETDVPPVAPGAVTTGTGSTYYLTGNEVVYAYTPSEDQVINVSTTNDDDWVGLWAFTGCPFDSTVGYHTATSGATRLIPALPVTAGETYYFVISTWDPPLSTEYTIHIELAGEPEPGEGPCEDKTIMECGETYTADLEPLSGEWTNYTDVTYNYTGSEKVWEFTAPETGEYIFELDEGMNDADFFLMDACSNTANNLSDGYWTGLGDEAITLTEGVTYYLIADLFSQTYTTVSVRVICPGDQPDPEDYCEPVLDCSDGDVITNVTFAEINNDSDCSPNGYGDYTSMLANVEAGGTYEMSVTVGAGWDYEAVMVWIDFNNDFTFDPVTEYFFIGSDPGTTNVANITIPAGTADGEYRMRVRVGALNPDLNDLSTFACEDESFYGETEDYTVNVGELGVSNMNNFEFAYYPNPVKDVLNVSANKNVENVSIFNLAGQKVLSNAKVTNGQINVNALTPGTYVFRVTLEGGQVETFKIIKK